jgi:hypothetical protein
MARSRIAQIIALTTVLASCCLTGSAWAKAGPTKASHTTAAASAKAGPRSHSTSARAAQQHGRTASTAHGTTAHAAPAKHAAAH